MPHADEWIAPGYYVRTLKRPIAQRQTGPDPGSADGIGSMPPQNVQFRRAAGTLSGGR